MNSLLRGFPDRFTSRGVFHLVVIQQLDCIPIIIIERELAYNNLKLYSTIIVLCEVFTI
jgi:hypothetical protein